MCGGAFGSGAFGSTSFGSGSPLSHLEVVQVALNAIEAEFDSPVRVFDPGSPFDALYPGNWTIEAYIPYNATVRLAQYVERVSSTRVRVYFDGPLDAPAIYRVTANTQIESLSGVPIVPCTGVLFATFQASSPMTPISQVYGRWDLSNRNGQLDVASTGDVANQTGLSYLRKRIRRRAVTAIGSFYHLPGYGFAEGLKQRVTPSLMMRMSSRAKVQILQEPDVADVIVTVQQKAGAPSIVLMKLRVTTRTGEIINMDEEIDTNG
jgi:hypothetical protein